MVNSSTCPQCGQQTVGGLCAGVCPQCMASSMLGEWGDMAELEAPPDELIITRVADYDVLRVLGRGGMGVVCRARDRLLGRDVALKLMHSGVLASDEELRRFRTEAEAVARLKHPNLVSIYEAGDADGQAYYTMSLAEGGTLAERLVQIRVMEPRAAAELVECLANAIHHAHTRGVLHRDLKPANIVFDGTGTPMVSDFGLARMTGENSVTHSGSLVGTPAYIAPEVAAGSAGHTTSSDVYALGVILYECLTGRAPFENDSPLALLKIITEREPAVPSSLVEGIDGDLEAICLKALEKTPERRYSSAEAFAQDLRHWLNGEPVAARPPLLSERFWRWAHRHQSRAILYTMAAVSLLILVVASAVMNILMTQEQSRLTDAMRRSDIRRAALLRDFASRLLIAGNFDAEPRSYLLEASSAGTGDRAQDHGIGLRLRIIDRLTDAFKRSIPAWQGRGIERVWFTKDGRLCFKAEEGTLELAADGTTKPSEEPLPKENSAIKPLPLLIKGKTVRSPEAADQRGGEFEPLLHPTDVASAEKSRDDRYLAVMTETTQLYIWELATGLVMSPPLVTKVANPNHLLWEPTKHHLVVWNDHELKWFDW